MGKRRSPRYRLLRPRRRQELDLLPHRHMHRHQRAPDVVLLKDEDEEELPESLGASRRRAYLTVIMQGLPWRFITNLGPGSVVLCDIKQPSARSP